MASSVFVDGQYCGVVNIKHKYVGYTAAKNTNGDGVIEAHTQPSEASQNVFEVYCGADHLSQ
jgi:hypothetical protein